MVDDYSIMKDDAVSLEPTLTDRIAARVASLRAARGYSLDDLASASGVSRSMISVIERGESSPTATVLEKLSVGLGVPLA
jgi:transcriptional regulator with XRE-family HTH domain